MMRHARAPQKAAHTAVATAATSQAKEKGLTVAVSQQYPTGTKDYSTLINQLKSGNVQAVFERGAEGRVIVQIQVGNQPIHLGRPTRELYPQTHIDGEPPRRLPIATRTSSP